MNKYNFDFMGNRKTIELDEIRNEFHLSSHCDTLAFIEQCISRKILQPCGKLRTLEAPRIPIKYKRVAYEKKEEDFMYEINYSLNPTISKTYIRKSPAFYSKNRDLILCISNYLNNPSHYQMAVNERSFLIFGNEKTLWSIKDGFLKKLGLSLENFNVYSTPEPFFYYFNGYHQHNSILIVENKDTWYTMKSLIYERKPILGMYFDAIIYGEGRKIEHSFESISSYEYKHLVTPATRFFYFGDIDSYGIAILHNLITLYPSLEIHPFTAGYQFLLEHYDNRRLKEEQDRVCNDKLNIVSLFPMFSEEENLKMKNVLSNNEILPQEILNNERLREYGR